MATERTRRVGPAVGSGPKRARRGRAGRAAAALLGLWLALLGASSPASAQLVDPGTVIQTIDASLWSPPAPDTAGITYRPDTGELLTCDSEVDEMTIFAGVNLWTHSRTGVVSSTATTTAFSNEPTGISWDPAGGRLWITDDVQERIFEIKFGPDGVWNTADDIRTSLRGYNLASCDDLEDIAYNNFDGHLYIASGLPVQQVCEIDPGPNGVFSGAATFGDDVVTTFSIFPFGILEVEGIVYDPFWNTLVVADRDTRDLYELTPEGGYLRKIDVNFPNGTKPSGVTIAPGSANPLLRNYWVTDRKVDNGANPFENDGRIFEVVAIPLGGNGPPIVDAGPPQTITWPANSVSLSGFVSDDGHPYPPSLVLALWSKQSGPGSVSFGSASSASTTATFSAPGSYVLQLEGNDSLDQTVDTVAINVSQIVTLSLTSVGPGSVTVNPPGGTYLSGQTVTLTATPGLDAGLIAWSGDLTGNASPQPLVMNGNRAVTASFGTLYDVTVNSTGPGTVTLSPPGGSYPAGTVVTVTATPGANAVFNGFSGALTGTTSPQLLTVNADKTINASFTQHYTLSVSTTGPGSVTLSPPTGPYALGTTVTVTATPSPDAVFQGFGGNLTGTTSPQPLVMNGNKSITAGFAALYDVSVSTTGPGSVTLSPPGGSYAAGTVVTVTATPGANAVFDGFSGALTGTTSPQLLSIDADKNVGASFTQHYTLSVSTTGPGSVTLSPPSGPYAPGSTVTVTATPSPDAVFQGFGGDLTGTTSPQPLVMNGNQSITAGFVTLYDVTLNSTGPGTVTLSPPGGTYAAGTVVSVLATPGANAAFDGFSGALNGTTSPQFLTIDADETINASFTQLYTLSVSTTGPGSVTLSPPGGSYASGTLVTLIAVPGASAVFSGWGGALGGSANPETLTVSTSTAVSASFTQLFNVSAAAVGPGSVTLSPPTGPYPTGSVVTVTAIPAAEAAFVGWSGDLSGSANPAILIVDANESVTGNFAPLYDVTVNATGPGAVTLDPPGGTYVAGTVVSVTATPGLNAVFDGFGGALTGSASPQLLTVDGDKTLSASFTQRYSLSVATSGPGSVTLIPPGGSYAPGTLVTLIAVPSGNAVFSDWSGALSGSANPETLIIGADTAVSASFAQLYSIATAAVGPGSVILDPPTGPYAPGTTVTVTAIPSPDAVFQGWSGDLSGSVNPAALVVDANESVTATFANLYDVSVNATGPGAVTLDPPGGTYVAGTVVSVSAAPGVNAVFDGFAGDLSGTASPQLLTVDADKTVSASFTQHYTVSASASGPGSVTLDPPTGLYALGTIVTVTATPGANAVFDGFAGDLSGTASPQLLTVDADKAVSASFTQHYTVSASASGPGSLTLDPPTGPYAPGTIVSVTATPGANAVFDGFTGDLSGTASPQLLTVDADKTVSASFTQHYTVSASASGPGSVTLDPPTGPYAPGTIVSVTATPGANAVFDGFAGDLSGTASPQLLTVDADKTVSASFTQHYTVSASASGPGSLTVDPPGGTYAAGTVVSVSAAPGVNAVFDGFAGDLSGTASPQLLTVDSDKTVSASFTQHYTVSASASGPGSVTLDPPTGLYALGTIVTVTATPGANAVFDGFAGDLSGTASPQLLTVDADKAVSASFTQHYTVSASATGPGSVTLDPATGPYAPGTIVSVTATPGANAVFDGFAGDLSGTASPQLLTVDADKAVSASFTQHYTVSASATGPGSVTLDPATGPYAPGTVVSVTATPGANAVFDGFAGDLSGTASPQLLTVDSDKTVSASFTQHYTVSASASGPGSLTLDPPGGTYAAGTVVSVSAAPGVNAVFDGFAGDLSGTASPQLLTVDADKAVSASFTQHYTVSASASGPGSLTLDPATGPYAPGTIVSVTATPGANAVFDGFAGDLSGTASPQLLTVDADKVVSASFTQHYTVSAIASGPGSVTLDPPTGPYAPGTVVSVTATPGANAVFDGFAGDLSGTASPQLLTVDSDKTVSASFTQHYTVSASASGPGSLTLDPPGGTYAAGTVVSVSAAPGVNAVFDGFAGDLSGTASPQLLTVDSDKTVSASFTQHYTVSASASGPGSLTLDPATGPYAPGTIVSVTATPGANAVFDGFAGDLSGTASPQLLAVDADKVVSASFTQHYTVSASATGPGSVTLDPSTGPYAPGTIVSVTATPGANAVFDGFAGDLSGTASPQLLTVDSDKTVSASFTQHYTVSAIASGPGSLTLDPPGGTYAAGTVVSVSAAPGVNAVFDGFAGDLSGTASPQLLTVDADKTVSASFTQHYTVSASASGPGSLTLDPPGGTYAAGTVVSVSAAPGVNAVFDGFAGDLSGTASPQLLTVDADKAVSASFTQHYTVSASATGPGSVTLDPATGPYAPGTIVSVTATPGANAVFDGFAGDLSGTASPQLLTVDADKVVSASFTQHYTVSASATGPGSVTLDPATGPYAPGTIVSVTATPGANAVFDGFAGDLSGTASPQLLTVDADKAVSASFTQHYTVSAIASGPGSLTLDPPGGTYAAGTVVSVSAAPGVNAVFDGFAGDLSGTASPQLLTVDADKAVSASFTQHYTVSASASGPGSLTLDPATGPYAPGTIVSVTATPGANAVFDGFAGDLSGTASPQLLTVDADKVVSASFTQHYTVSASATGPGSVTLDPATGPYAPGTIVSVTATPGANAVFDGFAGDLSGTASPQLLTVDSDKTVSASFTQHYTVSASASGPGSLTLDPPGGTYAAGTVVSVSAAPGVNAVFDGFAGDLSGTASPQLLTVDSDKTVSASFTQHYTVSASASGPGSVTLDPPTGLYALGTIVSVTATPGANAVFDGFAGDLSGTASPQLLIVDADKAVSASFTQHYTVSASASGPGSVTLDPPTGPYAPGTVVSVTATPGANAVFDGFSGDLSGTASPQLLTVDADKTLSASFTQHYTVSASASGPGSVTLDPATGPYAPGTVVTVTASPSPDAVFQGWSGDLSGSVNPAALVVDANESVTATFASLYDVSVNATGPGAVTLDPPGGTYAAGTVVSVSAAPGLNAVFDGFAGDLSGTASPQLLTVDADKTVSASFTQHYTVSASATGPGSVTLDPPTGLYALGTIVTITATPGANAVFDGFGGDLSGTASPQLLIVDADKAVSASFTQHYTVSASATGPGSVTLDPATGLYAPGTIVSVTATPGANAVFDGFAGDLGGTASPQLLIVDADKTVSASFTQLYTVSASASGPGSLTLDPPTGPYAPGTVVTVTAIPSPDAVFQGWSGDLSGSVNPAALVVAGNKSVTATFASLYDVSVNATGPGAVTLDPPGGTYVAGTVVSVSASPGANAVFDGFAGDLSGSVSPQLLTVDADKTVSASFTQHYTVSASATGPGSVTLDPPTGPYAPGAVVTVTATPGAHGIFGGFSGDLSGTASPQLLTVDADKTVSASFTLASYVLVVTTQGGGLVTVDPPTGPYPAGSSVTLTAAPISTQWLFGSWSGSVTGSANPLLVVMDGNKAVHATFNVKGGGGGGSVGCGMGPELAAALPLLAWLHRRRRRAA